MGKQERIIVSLTSWKPRYKNLPEVLASIFSQSVKADMVVLNVNEDDPIPSDVLEYLSQNGVEINKMPDFKVYKKLIPTLKKYPDDCVISIDDDWIYPAGMIEDFCRVHNEYPNSPVSGNREQYNGVACHCGCASLTKASFFGEYLDLLDESVVRNCPSDDIFYTFLALKNGRKYVRTSGLYFDNLQPLNQTDAYSDRSSEVLVKSWDYLDSRFGLYDHKMLVALHMDDPAQTYYFASRLSNLKTCAWDLVVTGDKVHEQDLAVLKDVNSHLRYLETGKMPAADAFDKVMSSADRNSYDFVMKLVACKDMPARSQIFDSMRISYELRDHMADSLLGEGHQFNKVLKKLERPSVGMVIPSLSSGDRCMFAAKMDALSETPSKKYCVCRVSESATSSLSFYAGRLMKYLFSLDRLRPDGCKYLVLFGLKIKLDNGGVPSD